MLGTIGGTAVIAELKDALRDRDVEVRREAVWALARMACQAAVSLLEEARRDNDPEVRGIAAEVLTTIRRRHSASDARPPLRNRPTSRRARQ